MGAVVNGMYLNTESGLTPLLDRLTATVDQNAQSKAIQGALARSSYGGLTPADAPAPSILSRMLGGLGLGPDPSAQTAAPPTQTALPAPTAAAAAPSVGRPMPGFDSAVNRTLGFEGGLNAADTNGTPSNYGINQAAHPGIDVSKLTPDQAKGIYKSDYWDKIGADSLPPALSRAAFDTAVIAGPQKAQELLAQSGGDPMKFMNLREQFQNGLIQSDPQKYGQYGKAWQNRNNGLRLDIAALTAGGTGTPPSSAMAYAPSTEAGSSSVPNAAPVTEAGPNSDAAPMMPLATSSTNVKPSVQPAYLPQPSQEQPAAQMPQQQAQQPQAAQMTAAPSAAPVSQGGTPAAPTIDQIRQLVLEPATRQLGLQLWQQAIAPKDTVLAKPGDTLLTKAGKPLYTAPAAPLAVREGGAVFDPATHAQLFSNPKPTGYRPATAEERKALGVGPTTPLFFDAEGKPSTLAGGTNVTVNNAVNPILKGLGDQFVQGADAARSAADMVRSIQVARSQLGAGIFTGTMANQALALQKIGAQLGVADPAKIQNTETFQAAVGPIVLSLVKNLGSGSGITDADREFAEKMAGGNIKLDQGSIGRVLDIQERAARARIDRQNSLADQMLKTQPDLAAIGPMMHITPPPMGGQSAPQTAAQDTSPIGQARAAIAAGAPRDQVLQRLQQSGIDFSGQGL